MKLSNAVFLGGLLVVVLWMPIDSQAATIEWDAGGDGFSIYQEANWVVTDDSGSPSLAGLVGSDPPAGFVDPSFDVQAHVVAGGFSIPGGGSGGSAHFDLASNRSLTVRDHSVWRMTSGAGIRGVSGGGINETLTIEDNAQFITQFLLDLQVTMTDNAKLVFNGGGNPVNFTRITLANDWKGTITFTSETPIDVINEHLFKMPLDNGDPLVLGVNASLVSHGGNGSLLALAIPEPTGIALCGLTLVSAALLLRSKLLNTA